MRHTILCVVFFGAFFLSPWAGAEQELALEIEGTWHVLVHYQDRNTEFPERWHWEDRVWVMQREGENLRWKDYPIVVFKNEKGRFEALGGNRASRSLHRWEPNKKQLREIKKGLRVNDRGALSKRLKKAPSVSNPADAEREAPELVWASDSGQQSPSAMMITYIQRWSVLRLGSLPIFHWSDSLESGLGEGLEGNTIFRVTEKSSDGTQYAGSYERDGTRFGTFRILRSGPIRSLGD